MNYQVYILKSLKDKRNYTGYSSDLKKRLSQHDEGRVKSTRNRRPLKLIYSENHDSKTEAGKRERFFKSRQGRRELEKILGAIAKR